MVELIKYLCIDWHSLLNRSGPPLADFAKGTLKWFLLLFRYDYALGNVQIIQVFSDAVILSFCLPALQSFTIYVSFWQQRSYICKTCMRLAGDHLKMQQICAFQPISYYYSKYFFFWSHTSIATIW